MLLVVLGIWVGVLALVTPLVALLLRGGELQDLAPCAPVGRAPFATESTVSRPALLAG